MDYVDNKDNEGHISVMLINLGFFDIIIHKGDKIAQFVFEKYEKTTNDISKGKRIGGYGSTGK